MTSQDANQVGIGVIPTLCWPYKLPYNPATIS